MSKMPRNQKNFMSFVVIILLLPVFLLSPYLEIVNAQGVTDLEQQIEKKKKEISDKKGVLGAVEGRIEAIKSSNSSIQEKIKMMTEEIEKLKSDIETKDKEVQEKIKEIESKQGELMKVKENLDVVSGSLYVETRNKMANFIFADWKGFMQNFYIRKGAVTVLKEQVEKINGEFSSLADARSKSEKEKEELDQQKKDLADSQKLLAEEKAKLQAELDKRYSQKSSLSAEITDLNKNVSQLQSALIAARSAGTISSGGSTETVPGTSISPAPTGSFGVFSIGAYTHRNGMSQWGARARADAGQNYRTLLSVYYPSAAFVDGYGEPATVRVLGKGVDCNNKEKYYDEVIPFDTYMRRIYEMPASWNIEALKAQAIAARTYALHKIKTQGYVIPNQSNQVYKDCDNASGWVNAVSQTKGQVLLVNNNVFASEYAAVHGGWGNHVGWDTVSGNGNDWFNDAWERKSGVTWFYRSWYISGSGRSGETCGHSPYLSNSEMAIMLNAYLIKNDIGLKRTPDKSRLLPSDYGSCPGRLDYGRNDKTPYTLAEMQSLLANPVTSVSSVSTALADGKTISVTFETNRGSISITGLNFKNIYNQMAPGHMRIQQQSSYAYFNVEAK